MPSEAPKELKKNSDIHTVSAGENLYRIALAHSVTVEALVKENGLGNSATLSVGQKLKIPRKDTPIPSPVSRREGRRVDVAMASSIWQEDTQTQGTLSWPVRGVLYARFGKKGNEPHDGIDLAAPAGTPIQTAAPGNVLYAGEQKGYGLIAIVEHDDSLVTVYAHNRDLRVQTGQKVRAGQVIATVGESGRTSGPHLHFEVRQNGRPVDPLHMLAPLSTERVGRRPPSQ